MSTLLRTTGLALLIGLGAAFTGSAQPSGATADDAATAAVQDGKKQGDDKKDPRVKGGQKGKPKADAGADAAEGGDWEGEPYTLDTCAASGRPIDVKGTPQTVTIEGREVKFCCKGCAAVVAKEPGKWLPEVDEKLMAQQAPLYPTDECIVSGEPLYDDEGEFTGVEFLHKNRLFRTCCKMCAKKVREQPYKYAQALNQMVMDQYAKDGAYPMEVCAVSGEELPDEPKVMVVAGRPVKLCCGMCVKQMRKNPMLFLPEVDAALAKARAKDEKAGDGDDGGDAKKKDADDDGKKGGDAGR